MFRTYEPSRDRHVAVKVFRLDITPEQARALADALSRAAEAGLFHPSIVEPIAAGVEGTVAYCAEEYVAAETLDVAMRHYAPATLDKALPFITQLAGAIDFARVARVGHGALHPRDIFVTPEEARATGFGVVDSLERIGLRAPVRRPYSAPERIEGQEWSTPADIFSLAAIAFELLTARRPSGVGAGIGTLAGANVGDRADALLRVLVTAMDADPSRRYPTALAFAGALESASRPEASIVPFPAPVAAAAAPPVIPKPADPGPVPAPPATPPIAEGVEAEDEDDITGERDEDELHHDLLLREREEAEAAEAATPSSESVEEDPEAAADRLLIDAGAVASADARQHAREDVREGEAVASAPRTIAPPPPVSPRPRTLNWDEEPSRSVLDREDDYRPAAAVVPAQGSRVLPLAAILSIGLLVGFAVGYGVGSRDPGVEPASPAGAPDAQRPTAAAPAGKDWSEQSVAQPTGTSAGASRQPSATPPPVPSEAPAEPSPRRPARPALTSGRIVVRSTPSRAGVTINDRWRGRTPLTLEDVPFGKYSVRVVQPGYTIAREEFVLSAGDPQRTFSVRLQPTPSRTPARTTSPPADARGTTRRASGESRRTGTFTGSIYVDSRPRGARVFIDRRPVGTTPLSIPDVPIGAHVVRLEMPDHRAWTTSTRVTAGEQARVTGSLERIR